MYENVKSYLFSFPHLDYGAAVVNQYILSFMTAPGGRGQNVFEIFCRHEAIY